MLKTLFTSLIITLSATLFAQTWETYNELPATASGRNHPITFSIGDTGYVLTGYGDRAGTEMSDFYKFDSQTETWIKAADFAGGARGFGYGVSTNGKGYAGFGLFVNSAKNDLWEYDPATGEWSALTSCPCTPRWHPALIAIDDKIYMGLGSSAIGNLGDWYEYDITNDTWTKKPDFPGTVRHHPYYFPIGDQAYVGLGHGAGIYNDFYRYDPNTEKWTQVANLPDQGRVAGTQFTYDGKGYVLSGQGNTHQNLPTGEFWEYDPTFNQWTSLPAHPGTGRWAPGNWIINDRAYFIAGRSDKEEKDIMKYDFKIAASTKEIDAPKEISLFPNPTNGIVNFANPHSIHVLSAKLLSAQGEVLAEIEKAATSLNFEIDLTAFSSGLYFLNIELENGESVSKQIMKK